MTGFWEASDESSVLLFLGLAVEVLDFSHPFPGGRNLPEKLGRMRTENGGRGYLCDGWFLSAGRRMVAKNGRPIPVFG